MIDIESQIFTMLYDAIKSVYPNCDVKSELDLEPAKSPAVMIEEVNNSSNAQTATTTSTENHAIVDYEINIFSSKASGRKSEAKAILSLIDSVMTEWNFQRLMTNPVSLSDSTRYRLVTRYTAVVGKDETIYRR